MPSDIKRSVSYKILIKFCDVFYDIGTIVIKTYSGDILFTPSQKLLDDPAGLIKKEIEHVSWHAGGQVHIKYKGQNIEKYFIVQKNGERQKISEIGFQEMLQDTIKEFTLLPIYNKKVTDLDVIFDTNDYSGPVVFCFSIVSGKLIVAKYNGQAVPIKATNIKKDRDGIDSAIRALGHHSGNADIILQYSLRRVTGEQPRTNRRIFIPHDMKISKLNII